MIEQLFSHRGRGPRREGSRGQSLVEFALVLPILLIVVSGVLEVGNVLTIYNRVQLTAREGARFAAAGGSDVYSIIDQASRESLELNEDFMTVWVVRPTIVAKHSNGTPLPSGSWTWKGGSRTAWGVEEKCIFGDMCGVMASPITPQTVLDNLPKAITQADPAEIDGTTFAVVVVYYESPTNLNLPFWQADGTTAAGRIPIWAYGIMAQEVEQEAVAMLSSGCSAYSLLIERQHLLNRKEGDRFTLRVNQVHAGGPYDQFGFVGWRFDANNGNPQTNPSYVINQGGRPGSMNFPGTINRNDLGIGFLEYDDDPEDDTNLHRGDWVLANEAKPSNASTPLNDHISAGRVIRIMVYDYQPGVNPGYYRHQYGHPNQPNWGPELWQYRVDDFALVRIISWSPSQDTITFEFVRFDTSCGYDTGA